MRKRVEKDWFGAAGGGRGMREEENGSWNGKAVIAMKWLGGIARAKLPYSYWREAWTEAIW